MENGGTLQSLTFGNIRAGDVTVTTSELIKISGGQAYQLVLRRTSNGLPDVANAVPAFSPSSILSQSVSSGDAGNIFINTNQLNIENGGRFAASALASGASGDININAYDSVNISGLGLVNPSLNPSTISSSVNIVDPFLNFIYNISQLPSGASGNILINTGGLNLRDGGQVAVRNDGTGNAGTLQINADSVRLDNKAGISASTQNGRGGNININSKDLLLMRRNSQISTIAGNARAGGDGGSIDIDTNFLVSVPGENSDITANAFTGKGGTVQIAASGIFGFVPRSWEELNILLGTDDPNELNPARLPSSDITAISQTNPSLSGQLTINTPDVDPSWGLVTLPTELVDVSGLIAQGCPAGSGPRASKFVITGRGGLPDNPSETLNSDTLWTDLRPTFHPAEERPSSPPVSTQPTNPTAMPLVEANGWIINSKGEVVLTATAPSATLQVPWIHPSGCHGQQNYGEQVTNKDYLNENPF